MKEEICTEDGEGGENDQAGPAAPERCHSHFERQGWGSLHRISVLMIFTDSRYRTWRI